MKTITTSPARQLRALFPLINGQGLHVGDTTRFSDGTKAELVWVYDINDPRHIGQVVTISNSAVAKVCWSNGWHSWLLLTELHRAPKELIGWQ